MYILIAALIGLCGFVSAETTGEAVSAISARLVDDQLAEGWWPEEPFFAGTTVAGLLEAYRKTGNADVLAAGRKGCDYIISVAQGNYFGDEAYALMKMGEITDESAYLLAVQDFYRWIKEDTTGTRDYTNLYSGADPSTAVFYMAYHVLTAYGVEAADKQIWREMLRYYLGQVDDSSDYPVMALGAATWALAKTDTGLDPAVPVIPSGKTGRSFWNGVNLAQLPQLISGLQLSSEPGKGAFYDRLEPGVDSLFGYTEDAAYCMLGLKAAKQHCPPVSLGGADFSALYDALMSGVYFDYSGEYPAAVVYGHLLEKNPLDKFCFYASEMLMALSSSVIRGDADMDDFVGPADLTEMAGHWLSDKALAADFDASGKVDLTDFAALSRNWQSGR